MSTSLTEWVWWVEDNHICVGYYNDTQPDETKITSPDASIHGQELRLFFNQKEAHFDLPSESTAWGNQKPQFPEQFHDALVNKAIAMGYERNKDTLPLAQYFNGKFEDDVKNARKYAYRGRLSTFRTINSVDF